MPGLLLLLLTAAILVVLVLTIVVVYDATHPVRRSGAYAAVRGLPFDPGDLGLAFEAWTLDVPGARLPVWEVALNEHEAAKRVTAVFVHGWGESRLDVLKDIESWRGAIDRAVLYDLRGHGDSSPGPSRLGHGEDDDLVALLAQLGDGGRTILIGNDLGANIAIAAANKASEAQPTIAGVIAMAPYDDFHAKLRDRLRARGHPTWPMTNLAMAWWSMTRRAPLAAPDQAAPQPCLILEQSDEDAAIEFARKLRP